MAFTSGNPVVGGTVLRRAAIESPNFITGVSGWDIRQDGSAEFNNLTIRGTFNGTDFIINSSGAFFYSAAPALGNLIASIASLNGTDAFGNAYQAGVASYNNPGLNSFYCVHMYQAFVEFLFSNSAGGPYTSLSAVRGDITNTAIDLQAALGVKVDTGPFLSSGGTISSPSLITTDTWHAMTLVGSTTAGVDINGTSYPPSYTLTAQGDLKLRGVVVSAGGGLASGTTFATLPTGYRPTTNIPTCLVSNGNHGTFVHVYIRPNGNLQFNAALGATVSIFLDCTLNIQGT